MEHINTAAMVAVCPLFLIISAFLMLIPEFLIKRLKGIEGYTALAAGLIACISLRFLEVKVSLFNDVILITNTTIWLWIIVLLSLITVIFVSLAAKIERAGIYYFLLFFSAAGTMLTISSNNLFFAFISSECAISPLYFLISRNKQGLQAAYKFSTSGIFFSALSMLGLAILNYTCPSLSFSHLSSTGLPSALTSAGFLLFAFGFAFKSAAAPFNLAIRDALKAASPEIAAYIAVVLPLGAIPVLYKVYGLFYSGSVHSLIPVLAILTLILGALFAFYSDNVRKLAVELSFANIGITLLAFCGGEEGYIALLYHLPAFSAALLGIFLFSSYFEKEHFSLPISKFAGFAVKKPIISSAALICLLSLVCFPFFAGFTTVFYILFSLLLHENYALVIFSCFGLFFMAFCAMNFMSTIFFEEPSAQSYEIEDSNYAYVVKLSLFAIALFILVYGIFPQFFIAKITAFI